MRCHVLLSFAALVGCSAALDPPLDALPLVSPRLAFTLHGDTRFTPAERESCERAARKWGAFTGGRARIAIVWDVDEMNYLDVPLPMLYRSPRTPETGDFGGITNDRIVRLVPELCTERASVETCALHEFGHLLGLEHVPESGQLMSAHNPSRVFGVADRRECIRVGVCAQPSKDVTTVTVTVDPAIPRVEPDYPRSIP